MKKAKKATSKGRASKTTPAKRGKTPAKPASAQIRMVIQGEEIFLTHEQVPIGDINLDPSNPRIRNLVRRHCGTRIPSPDELQQILWDVHGVSELYTKVRDNEGTIEPILISWDGTVIEGNCRTVAYRKLHVQDSDDPRWQTIPAHRFPKGVSARRIAILLAMYHVIRKIPWPAYEQAGQVYEMTTVHKMTPKEIEKAVGIREKVVISLLSAYRTMTDVYLPLAEVSGDDGVDKFSYFLELYKSPKASIIEFRKDPTEFATWVAEGKFKRGEDVRDLHKILDDAEALKHLRTKDHKKALATVGKTDPSADSRFFRCLVKTTKALQEAGAKEYERLKRPAEAAVLRDLQAALKAVADLAGIDLE